MVFRLLHFSPFFFSVARSQDFHRDVFKSNEKMQKQKNDIKIFFCSRSFFHPRRIPSNICLHLFVFCDDLLLIEFPPQPPRKQIFKSLSVCLSVLRHYVLIHTQEHTHTSTSTPTQPHTHTYSHKNTHTSIFTHTHTLTC